MKTKTVSAHLDLAWQLYTWHDIYTNCNKAKLIAHSDSSWWPELGIRHTWRYDQYVTDAEIAEAVAHITEYIGRFIVGADEFDVSMVQPPEWIEEVAG